MYLLERLAARWGCMPADITGRLDEPEMQAWVDRALLFMHLEAEARQVHRG